MTRIAYLLKKFPRLSETFVLGEILGQEKLGADVHVFSRRHPDDEPRHPAFARLQAEIEVVGSHLGLNPWMQLFGPHKTAGGLLDRFGGLVRELAAFEHDRMPALFAEALWLLKRTRELDIDHVHVHFATDSAITAMILADLGGPSYSLTAHAKDIYRSTVDVGLLDRIVERSSFTVTVCDANVRHLEERLSPAAMHRVRRLYNGIDLSNFSPTRTARDARHVLSVGRLVEKKGFHTLLDAVAELKRRGEDLELTLVGDGEERNRLDEQVQALGVEDRVRLTGPLDQGAIRELMARATVFCLPCQIGSDGNRDALPTVLLEALAMKLPIVSTPVTGIPEILDDGRAGVLVPERDASATADALARLLADEERREQLAQHGRTHALANFDTENAARCLHSWFEQARDLASLAS